MIDKERKTLEEIFEICEMKFEGEPYLLPVNKELMNKWSLLKEKAGGKKAVSPTNIIKSKKATMTSLKICSGQNVPDGFLRFSASHGPASPN